MQKWQEFGLLRHLHCKQSDQSVIADIEQIQIHIFISAVIGKQKHEDYDVRRGIAAFSVKDGNYDNNLEMLRGLDVGETIARNCKLRCLCVVYKSY